MRKACKHDADSDAVHLARAADIVRREIFNKKESSFSGSYNSQCQASSVPNSLVAPSTDKPTVDVVILDGAEHAETWHCTHILRLCLRGILAARHETATKCTKVRCSVG